MSVLEKDKKILVINPYYYPGYRSGGPQQTIMNLVEAFGERYNFYVLTKNHDMGEDEPYEGIEPNKWSIIGNAYVYYYSKDTFGLKFLAKIVSDFSIIYLCGPYYDFSYKILLLNRIGMIKQKIILAPMGSFTKGALSKKGLKKQIFWQIFKLAGLFDNITWSVTSKLEKNDLNRQLGRVDKISIAEDLPKKPFLYNNEHEKFKKSNSLKIIYLSRICKQKGLLETAHILYGISGDIQYDIYGPKEDIEYFDKCVVGLNKLSMNVKWEYLGEVVPDDVVNILEKYDVFILPTHGENFGHIIYEALLAGCIPVISDTTPWSVIESIGCGKVLSLNDIEGFRNAISNLLVMNNEEYKEKSSLAKKYAIQKYKDSVRTSGYPKMFDNLLNELIIESD